MSRLLSWLIVGAAMPSLLGASPELIAFRQAGGTIEGVFLAREGTLSPEMAISYAERIGQLNRYEARALKVTLFAKERDASEAQGKSEECLSYAACAELTRKANAPSGPIAEMFATKAGRALRYRTAEGKITKQVLGGEDPYVLRAGDSVFEIVHLRVSLRAPLLRNRPGGDRRVEVFLRTSNVLSEDDCGKVTAQLADLLDHNFVWATCRTDVNFWYDSAFPAYHPFFGGQKIPTVAEFQRSNSFVCSVDRGERSCVTLP